MPETQTERNRKARGFVILTHTPFSAFRIMSYLPTAIRIVSGSLFDHALMVYKDCDGSWFCIESTFKGVQQSSFEVFENNNKKRNRRYFLAGMRSLDFQAKHAKSLLGLHYDFGVFPRMFVFCIIRRILGRSSSLVQTFSLKNDPNAYFCFEFVGECFGVKDPSTLTGVDFEEKFGALEIELQTLLRD